MKSAGTFKHWKIFFFLRADNVSTRKYSHWWTRVTSALIPIYCAKEALIKIYVSPTLKDRDRIIQKCNPGSRVVFPDFLPPTYSP